jgi:hypothetical protein
MTEWEQFKVGQPSQRPNWTEKDCQPFSTVSHTSHINPAVGIVEGTELRPSLVFDESILNQHRILVSWVSPNHWGTGFRYGTVKFDFEFSSLIHDRRFFWVEAIAYKVRACRILITDKDYSDILLPYNPSVPNGPWWFDDEYKRHYFNGNYCLEFMIEAPISLRYLSGFEFVKHHDQYCSMHRTSPSRCAELGLLASQGGARFLARAAVMNTDLRAVFSNRLREVNTAKMFLRSAFMQLITDMTGRVEPSGNVSSNAIALSRAAMSAYTWGHRDEAHFLAAKFKNYEALSTAVAKILTDITGLNDCYDFY